MGSAGIGVADAPLAASVLVRSRGGDHRFFIAMAAAMALLTPARFALAQTDGWMAVAQWLTR
jgi:hypothetical protein